MTYRIMLLVELTKLSDMSDNLVVMAEHTMPKPSPPIKIRSSAAFKMAETIKKRSGVRASPTLLNPAANAL